ncbi:phage holin family protein [Peptostreptococcus stomatis]
MKLAMEIFEFFRACASTQESRVLFVLALIAVAMIVDFVTGTIAAFVNPEIDFKSKAGINGILRKIASMMALIVFLPVSTLLPNGTDMALIYTLYLGYLFFEIKSIIENIGKNGTDTTLFKNVLSKMSGNNE